MAQPHIVVETRRDGSVRVHDHPTKAAAQKHGMALRRAGNGNVFVHSKAIAAQFGLDPRSKTAASRKRTAKKIRAKSAKKSRAANGAAG